MSDLHAQLARLLMVLPQDVVEQPALAHEIERRWVDRVAPKISKEIRVLLEHDDAHAGTSEEKSKHHPRGTAAGYAAPNIEPFHDSSGNATKRGRPPLACKHGSSSARTKAARDERTGENNS